MKLFLIPRLPNQEQPLSQVEVVQIIQHENFRFVKNVTRGALSLPDLGKIPGDPNSGGITMEYGQALDLLQFYKKEDIKGCPAIVNALRMGFMVPVHAADAEALMEYPSSKRDSDYYQPGVSHPQVAFSSEFDQKLQDVEDKEKKTNEMLAGRKMGSKFVQRQREDAQKRIASGETEHINTIGDRPPLPTASAQRPPGLQEGPHQVDLPDAAATPPTGEGAGLPLQPGPMPTQQTSAGDIYLNLARELMAEKQVQLAFAKVQKALELGVTATGAAQALYNELKEKVDKNAKRRKKKTATA